MKVFGSICFFIFGLIFSAIVGFYLCPLLLKFNFPNMDLAAIWVTIIKYIVFIIGIVATLRGLAWLNEGRSE